MTYIFMAIFGILILVADQLTKYLTVANIDLYEKISVIPGFMGLTYVQNTGAAWSSFQGQTWLFVLVFLVFAGFILWEFPKKRMPFTVFERWCIVAVFAGGLGNMVDRLHLGYVVDMICVDFIEFPVFNVADCFITCGCIALIAHLFLCNKSFWKDEKKK